MKFVKALNSGIVTDLGIGQHVYKITTEGCEVEDSIAAKLKDVFGYLVEVTDVTPLEQVETPVATETAPEQVPETAPEVTPESAPEVAPETALEVAEQVPETAPEVTPESAPADEEIEGEVVA